MRTPGRDMRHTFTIYKWEMRKIIGNWRKTLAVFLLPAILLLAAINVFPLLMNYLSTGHLQSRPVTVVDAPDSFREYIDSNDKSSMYTITWMTKEEAEALADDEELGVVASHEEDFVHDRGIPQDDQHAVEDVIHGRKGALE